MGSGGTVGQLSCPMEKGDDVTLNQEPMPQVLGTIFYSLGRFESDLLFSCEREICVFKQRDWTGQMCSRNLCSAYPEGSGLR